jgi:hypothetical protein
VNRADFEAQYGSPAKHEPIRKPCEPPDQKRREFRDTKAVKSAMSRSARDRDTQANCSRSVAWLKEPITIPDSTLRIVGVCADAAPAVKAQYEHAL